LSSSNNIPVIPGRKNRIELIVYDKDKFKLRSKIENFFAKLKENRRLALRFEKSDLSFLGLIAMAAIKYNLCSQCLELYAYDFTEFCDFDIGDDGFYGYERLPVYWTEPTRFPYLIYVDKKIAGFILVQKGSPISDDTTVWDISEFFVMKKYN
jgi:hypothetical protein